MNRTQHTPGPWKIIDGQGPRYYRQIVTTDGMMTLAAAVNGEANAQLIAAAPELLEACIKAAEAIRRLNYDGTITEQTLVGLGAAQNTALAAITKAISQ